MNIVLLSGDLTVLARVEGAAARLGVTVRSAAGAEQAIDACRAEPGSVLVVDLGAGQLDIGSLTEALKWRGSDARIIAFGPHVHEERLNAARQAGCDEVISRGQFFAKLDAILSQLKSQ